MREGLWNTKWVLQKKKDKRLRDVGRGKRKKRKREGRKKEKGRQAQP